MQLWNNCTLGPGAKMDHAPTPQIHTKGLP